MYVSMKGMLKRANEGNYAVMAINCFNIETARAVINAAQSLRAPIIINIVQEHMVNHCDSNFDRTDRQETGTKEQVLK